MMALCPIHPGDVYVAFRAALVVADGTRALPGKAA
jgi:hypothetical protein